MLNLRHPHSLQFHSPILLDSYYIALTLVEQQYQALVYPKNTKMYPPLHLFSLHIPLCQDEWHRQQLGLPLYRNPVMISLCYSIRENT